MPPQVCNGATLMCTMGAAPSTLTVLPKARVMAGGQPAAAIADNVAMLNIAPFAMCISPTNPQVAAATAAASGVLTPQPCIPMIPAPWAPGSPTVLVGGLPALVSTDMCNCTWAGTISISMPGQMTVLDG